MAYDAGTAWLQVLPSFDNVWKAFEKEVEKMGEKLDAAIASSINKGITNGFKDAEKQGQQAGDNFGKGLSSGISKGLKDAKDDLRKLGTSEAKKGGEAAGGAYAESFNKRLTQGANAIGPVEVDANTSAADVKLAGLKRELEELRDNTIHEDMDSAEVIAKIEDLKRRLRDLSNDDVSLRVKVEAGEAARELALIRGLEEEVDRADPTVRVKTEGDSGVIATLKELTDAAGVSSSRIGFLIAIGATIGTAIVPAAAAAAAAIGAIGTAAGAAAAGIGVGILGFSGISGAVGAMDKAQQDADKSAASLTKSQNGVARSVDGVKSAEASLGNTRASVASGARRAAQTVVDAQRSVVDSQREARRAQEDLTRAYESARRAVEDQAFAIRDVALAQRQANLDVAEAKKKLDALLANKSATEAEREQARITYEQKLLQIDELGSKQKRLAAEKADMDKKGVAGSDQVTAAQEKIRKSTEDVAKANQRVAEALESQRDQQRQGAFQIRQAQQSVANAMRAVESASTSAGVAGGAAMRNLQQAMDQLGPSGQRFAAFLYGLKPVFLDLRNVAQAGLLPGVQQAITNLFPYLGNLKTFVANVANGLGDLAVKFVEGFKNPVWQDFFRLIGDQTVPMLQDMAAIAGNVATGVAAIVVAMSRFNGPIMTGLVNASQAFADWAARLKDTAGFQKFIKYVEEAGPAVLDMLKQLGILIVHIVEAAAPIGLAVVEGITAFAKAINSLPIGVLTEVLKVFIAFEGVLLALTIIIKVFTVLVDAKKAIMLAWGRMADAAGRSTTRLGDAMRDTERSTSAFGFGLQNVAETTRRTETATAKLANTVGRLRTAMANMEGTAGSGLARASAALTTAQGTVGVLPKGQEVVSNAMTAGIARYTTAITTAQGRVGLLAKAHEAASNVMTASMARVAAAVTTTDGRVSLLGRTSEVMAGAMNRGMSTVAAAITTTDGRISLLGRTQEAASNVMTSAVGRYRDAITTADGRVGLFARAHEGVISSLGRLEGALRTASTGGGTFVRAFDAIGTVGGKLKTSLGNLVGFLGGPWGVAITATIIGIGVLTDHMAKNKAKVEEVAQSYISLGKAIRQAREEGNKSAVSDLVKDNKDLQDLIRNADKYGLSADTVVNALAGEKQAVDDVNAALDRQKSSLERVITEHTTFTASGMPIMDETAKGAQKALTKLNAMRGGFHALVGDQENAAKAGEIYNRSTESGAEDMGLFAASVNDMRTALTTANPTAEQLGKALSGLGLITADVSDKAALYSQVSDKVATSNLGASEKADLYRKVLGGLGTATELHGPTFDALAKTFSNIAQSELSASDKSSLLKQSLDQLYGGVISQTEAAESLIRAQGSLATQLSGTTGDVKNSSAGFDLNTAASGKNRDAILGNRDALEAALQVTRDKYVADLAQAQQSGNVKEAIAKATVEHQKSMETILAELTPTQQQSAAVKALVEQYGVVPPIVDTEVKATGLDKAIDDMIDAHAIQIGLSKKPPWEKFQIEAEARLLKLAVAGKQAGWADVKAEGGPIQGWSPHPKADNIPIWATAREFMQPVASVDHYGLGVMELMRRRAVPRELFSPQMMRLAGMVGRANGGLIGRYAAGGAVKWPIDISTNVTMPVNVEDLWRQWEAARSAGSDIVVGEGPGFSQWPASPSAQRGDSGVWRSIVNLIRSTGPLSGSFGNAYRPGDPLWHGSGRAVDWMGYNQDALSRFLAEHRPLELIHRTSQRDYAFTRGRDMGSFNNALMEQHRNHVHVAYGTGGLIKPLLYDRGGMLRPGWNPPVYNGTGKPEPVLSPSQWGDISSLADQGTGAATTHNWHFRDTTLDPGKLRAIEDRQSALARVGRAR